MPANSKSAIDERRQKLFALLTRGMKGYEIAKELRVDSATGHFTQHDSSHDTHWSTCKNILYIEDNFHASLPNDRESVLS